MFVQPVTKITFDLYFFYKLALDSGLKNVSFHVLSKVGICCVLSLSECMDG